MKVYLCMCSDAPMFGDTTITAAVFLNEEHAKKYCEIHEALEEQNGYCYYVNDVEVQEDYDMTQTIKEYYCFSCDTREKTIEEIEDNWDNDPDEKYKRIYTKDSYVETHSWAEDNIHIDAYSTNSYEEARQLALETWRKYNESK